MDESANHEWEELLGDGIQTKIVKEGSGSEPSIGAIVEYSYIGRLQDGTIFSNVESKRARIGDGDDIPGIELSLRYMKPCEIREVKCSSRFAYGSSEYSSEYTGLKPVPPNSDVTFTLEFKKLINGKTVADMNFEEKIELALFKKDVGNFNFERSMYTKALQNYQIALDAAQHVASSNADENFRRVSREIIVACNNNIAMTHIKMANINKALEFTVDALTVDPNNVKALYRAGKILSSKGDFVEAKIAFAKALEIDPKNKGIILELHQLKQKMSESKKRMRELIGKMSTGILGQPPSDGCAKRTKSAISNLTRSSIYAVLIAIAAVLIVYSHVSFKDAEIP